MHRIFYLLIIFGIIVSACQKNIVSPSNISKVHYFVKLDAQNRVSNFIKVGAKMDTVFYTIEYNFDSLITMIVKLNNNVMKFRDFHKRSNGLWSLYRDSGIIKPGDTLIYEYRIYKDNFYVTTINRSPTAAFRSPYASSIWLVYSNGNLNTTGYSEAWTRYEYGTESYSQNSFFLLTDFSVFQSVNLPVFKQNSGRYQRYGTVQNSPFFRYQYRFDGANKLVEMVEKHFDNPSFESSEVQHIFHYE